MKTKLFLGMLFAASAMSVGTVSAKADELTWAGSSDSASWDTTNENWLNGDEPATWADGSDAIFDDDDDVATEVTIDEAITAQTVTVTGGEYSWILSDSGSLTVTGGSSSTSVSATINGSLSLAGGKTSFEKRVYIGYTADSSSATGSLEITDGTTTFGGIVRIGSRTSESTSEEASGSLTISGGTVIFETNVLAGYDEAKSGAGSSTGTITITGGDVTFSNQVRLGQGMSESNNGSGTATMTIGSSDTTGEEPTVAFTGTIYIGFGDLGKGTLNIVSGTVTFTGTVNISYPGDNSTGGDGSIKISGGDTTFSGDVNVGLSNSSRAGESTKASIEITGGSVTFSGTTTVTSSGTLTISGGTTILDEAGTLTVSEGGSITISGGTIDLHHAISNEGTITITEGSTVVFVLDGALLENTGSHTYTFIDGGTIEGWENISEDNFAYSNGAGIVNGRTEVDLTVAGQVTITTDGALDLIWTGTEDNYTWSTGGNNWKTAGGNTEEFLSDDNVTFDDTAASKNVTISEVIEAGTVTVSGADYTFEFSGAGSLVAETLMITDGATLTITGSGEKVTIGSGEDSGRTYIGYDGTGALEIIDGATTFKDIVSVGYGDSLSTANSCGTLTISGGSTTFEDLVRIGTSYTGSQGSDSTGLLEITDGEVTFESLVRIGAGNSSNETGSGTGTLSISGGTVTFEDRVHIGYSDLGTGTLEITGGTVIFNGNVSVSFSDPSLDGNGMGAGGTGTIKIGSVDGTGGDIDVTFNGSVYVGYTSDSDESLGTFEITDGTVKFTDDVYIGNTNSHDSTDISQGVFKISGGDVSFEGDNLYIGVSGESGASTGVGSLEISGGEVSISSTTYVGYNNAVVETDTTYGSLTITGGTTTFENEVYIGYDNRAGDVDGELTIAGGEVIFKDTLYIGYGEAGDGTLTLTGGEITLYETIENEGTIIISGDVVFVLDNLQGVTDSEGHITYTFITGTGTVEGWENLTLTTSNFEIDGAILTGRTQIEIGEAGQMTIVELADAADLVWAGTNSNNVWTETRDNKIWLNEGEDDYFYSYDNVTFDDTAANKAVVVAGEVAAGSVTVSGADYTFTIGDDSSLKANSLTITDTGSLKVDGSLAASEAEIAGSLEIAGGETTIDTITVDGSLSVSGTGSLTITDNLTSTGKVSIADSGTLSLTFGSATIADLTSTGSGSISVGSGATLSLTGTVDISTAIANDGSVSISDTTIFALNDALIVSTNTTDEVHSTTYTFITGSGTIENWHDLTYSNFTINGEAVTSARQIEFTETDGTIIYHDNAVAADLVWNGTDEIGKNIWTDSTDTDTNQDWLNGSRVDAFYDEDNVTFGDSGTKTVLVDASVVAGSVTVSGSGYTFTGLGDTYSITADSLTVESTGSLTIAVAENGSGSLTAGEAEIAGSLEITGGSFTADSATVSGALSTAGATTISGTLAIEGGSLIVSDGSLRADSLTVSGEEGSATLTGGTATVGIVTVGENSSLTVGASLTATSADISGTATVSGTMSVSGSLNVAGSLKLDGESASLTATSATVSGSLELTNGSVAIDSLAVSGSLELTNGSVAIDSLAVSGSLSLTGGKTTIGNLTSTSVEGVSGSISVSSDATLSLTGTVDISTAIANDGSVSISDTTIFVLNDALIVSTNTTDEVNSTTYTFITGSGTIENWHDLTYSNFTINGEAVTSARQIEFTETDGTIIYHDNAVAATLVWNGTEGNNVWTDSTDVDLNRDWLNGERADSFYDGDNVIFADVEGVTKTVVVDGVVPADTITVTGSGYTFTFNEDASLAANTLIIDGGSLTITEGTTKIGSDTDTGSVFVGYDEENRSTYNGGSLTIYGGSFTVAENLLVGAGGSLTIGKAEGEGSTTPVVTIGGDLAIMGATGTISSGSLSIAGIIEVTYGSSLEISGGAISVAGYLLIGGEDDTTSSSLTITNGSLTVSGHMEAAYGSSLEISGGKVSVSDYVLVYGDENSGSSSLSITGGSLTIGDEAESDLAGLLVQGGTLSVSGNDTQVDVSGNMYVNTGASATIEGGSTTVSGSLFVGYDEKGVASSGTLSITGGEVTVSNDDGTGLVIVGEEGSSLSVSGGSLTTDMLGVGVGATAEVSDNGSLTVSDFMEIADSGSLKISGGEVSVGNYILVYGDDTVGKSSLEITGGKVTIGDETKSEYKGLYVQGSSISVSGDDTQVDITGDMYVNAGGSAKISSGSTTVSGSLSVGYDEEGVATSGSLSITGGSLSANSLTIGGEESSVELIGGTTTLEGAVTIDKGNKLTIGDANETYGEDDVLLTADSASVSGTLEIVNGTVEITSAVVIDGSVSISGGDTYFGIVALQEGGTLTITGGDNGLYYTGISGENSKLTISGGTTQMGGVTSAVITEGATLEVTDGSLEILGTDGVSLEEGGSFIISGGTVSVAYSNISVDDSTLTISGGDTTLYYVALDGESSSFTISQADEDMATTVTLGDVVVYDGTFEITGGTVTLTSETLSDGNPYPDTNKGTLKVSGGEFKMSGGSLSAVGITVSSGSATFSGGEATVSGAATVSAESSLTISGTGSLKISGGLTSAGTLTIADSGKLELAGGEEGTIASVSVAKDASLTVSDGTVAIDSVDLSGTLSLTGGSTTLGDLTSTGSVSVSTDAELELDGTIVLDSAIENEGTITLGESVVFVMNDSLKDENYTGDGVLYTFITNSGDGTITDWHGLNYTDFTLNGEAIASARQLDFNTADGSIIYHEEAVAATLIWNGTTESFWTDSTDTDAHKYWLNNGRTDAFYDGDNVIFADLTGVNKTVAVDGKVFAGTITVTGENYSFTNTEGSASYTITADSLIIEDTGSLTITGNGTTTLGTATVSGSLTIDGGSLTITDLTSTETGSITVSGGSLTLDGTIDISSTISNTGTVSLGDSVLFVLNDSLATTVTDGTTYTFITAGSTVTDWSSLTASNFVYSDGTGLDIHTGLVLTTDGAVTLTAVAADLIWDGTSSDSTWVLNGTNWKTASTTGEMFYAGDNVTFDDTATSKNVAISGEIVAGNATVTGSGYTWTMGEGDSLALSTLTIDGGSVSSLGGSLTVSGNTSIYGGGSLTLGSSLPDSGGGSGRGSATFSGTVYVGYAGEGTIEITGGEVTFTSNLYVGHGTSDGAGSGSIIITGGHTTIGNPLYIGYAYNGDTTGSVEISGADTVVDFSDHVYVGEGGSGGSAYGSLKITDATVSFSTSRFDIAYGYVGDATGAVEFTNVSATFAGAVYVGYGNSAHTGTSSFSISGGTTIFNDEVNIARANGTGIAKGTMTISGGATVEFKGTLNIGYGTHGTGTLTIESGYVTFSCSTLNIGYSSSAGDGSGKLTISGGEVEVSSTVNIGYNSYGNGTIELTGGDTTFSSVIYVGQGNNSTGELKIGSTDATGGTATFSGAVYVGYGNNSNSSLSIGSTDATGGTATFSGAVYVGYGNNSTGTLSITGGTTTFSSSLEIGHGSSTTASFTMTGGEVLVSNDTSDATLTLTKRGTAEVSGGSLTADIADIAGSFTVSDSGSVAINSATVSGELEISGGSVEIADATVSGTFEITNGTAEIANATVSGTLSVSGGSVAINSLDLSGSLSLTGGETTIGDLASTGSITVSNGTLSLEGTIDISSAISNTGTVTLGDSVVFVLNGSLTTDGTTYTFITAGGTVTDWSSLDYTHFVYADGTELDRGHIVLGLDTDGVLVLETVTGDLIWDGTDSDSTWVVGGTNWKTEDGYDTVFANGDSVTFDASATNKNVTISGEITAGTVTVTGAEYTFSFGNKASLSAESLTITDTATLTIDGALTAGTAEIAGSLTISSGSLTITTEDATTIAGSVTISSGGSLSANSLVVSSAGRFIVSDAGQSSLGELRVDGGSVTISGGKTTVAGTAYIIEGGSTTIEGDSVTVSGSLFVGYDEEGEASTGTLAITGGSVKVSDDDGTGLVIVGEEGSSLSVSGGSLTTDMLGVGVGATAEVSDDGSLIVSDFAEIDGGKLTVSGGEVSVGNYILVYGDEDVGESSLEITGGKVTIGDENESEYNGLYVSGSTVTIGSADASETTLQVQIAGGLVIYDCGSATISNGTVSVSDYVLVGNEGDTTASSLTISGGKVTIGSEDSTGDLYVQGSTLSVSGDDTKVDIYGNMYVNTGGSATISGGSTTVSGSLFVGYDEEGAEATGSLAISGGSVEISGAATVSAESSLTINGTGSLKISGGLTSAGTLTIADSGKLELAGGEEGTIASVSVAKDASLTVSGGTVAIDSVDLSGTLSLTGGSTTLGDLTSTGGSVSVGTDASLELDGTIVLDSAIENEGTITLGESVVFVMNDSLKDDSYTGGGVLYTFITNSGDGTIIDWHSLNYTDFTLNGEAIASARQLDFNTEDGSIIYHEEGHVADLVWNGSSDAFWTDSTDTDDHQYWLNGEIERADAFYDGDNVTFAEVTDVNKTVAVEGKVFAGTITVSGSGYSFTNTEESASYTITAESLTISENGSLTVTTKENGSGTLALGTVSVSGTLEIVNGAIEITSTVMIDGSVSISGGTTHFGIVALQDGGTLTITGGDNEFEYAGISGENSKLTISGGETQMGTVTTSAVITEGATLEVTDGSLEILGEDGVSLEEGGSFIISGGTVSAAYSNTYVDDSTLTISGGDTTLYYVALEGESSFTISKANESVDTTVTLGDVVVYDGTFEITGGTVTLTSETLSEDNPYPDTNKGTLKVSGGEFKMSDGSLVAEGITVKSGSASISGGEATVSGAVSVLEGASLSVSGTGSLSISGGLTSTGTITVGESGYLSLDGTIDLSSAITNEGTITLGDSVSFVLNDALGTTTEDGTLYTFITGSGTIEGWDSLTYKDFIIDGEAVSSARQISFNTDDGSIIYNEEAVAADLVWDGSEDNNVWASNDDDVKNWTNGERSDSFYDGDNVTFTEDGYKEIEVSGEVIAGELTVEGEGYTFSGTEEGTEYSVSADTLTIESTGSLTVDSDGSLTAGEADIAGSLEIAGSLTAGSADISGSLEIGEGGSLTVTDTTAVSGELTIAGDATLSEVEVTGSMEVSDGKTTADSLSVSKAEDSDEGASVELTGGSTTVSTVTIGEDSTLTVGDANAEYNDEDVLLTAGSADVSGELEIAGGSAEIETVTVESTGTLTVDGGSLTITSEDATTITGSLSVSDGSLSASGLTLAEDSETTISGGTTTIDDSVTVASGSSLSISDDGSLSADSIDVSGSLTMSGGSLTASSATISSTTAEISGGEVTITTDDGDGTLTVSGSLTVSGGSLTADSATVSGSLAISGEGTSVSITDLTSTSTETGAISVGSGANLSLGGTIDLSTAISNSGTITLGDDVVFVLNDALITDTDGTTYTFITSGGTIDDWSSLDYQHFVYSDGSELSHGHVTINLDTSGTVVITTVHEDHLTWTGVGSNAWTNGHNVKDWVDHYNEYDVFYNGDSVIFADTYEVVKDDGSGETETVAVATKDVSIGEEIIANTVTVTGSGYAFTFSGDDASLTANSLTLTSVDGSEASLTLKGSGSITLEEVDVDAIKPYADVDETRLTINEGTTLTVQDDIDLTVDGKADVAGTLNIAGGTTTATSIGVAETGELTMTGGTLNADSLTIEDDATASFVGGNLNVGEITASTLSFGDGLTVGIYGDDVTSLTIDSAITLAGSVTFDAEEDETITLSGKLDGDGKLVKDGAGTLIVSGEENAYTGGTTVSSGTLEATSMSALGTGAVAIDSGATLELSASGEFANATSGSGTLNIANGAEVSFGADIGVKNVSVASGATLSGGATLTSSGATLDLAGNLSLDLAAGETITFSSNGKMTIESTASLSLSNTGSLGDGSSFTLVDGGTVSGDIKSFLKTDSTLSGLSDSYAIVYDDSKGLSVNIMKSGQQSLPSMRLHDGIGSDFVAAVISSSDLVLDSGIQSTTEVSSNPIARAILNGKTSEAAKMLNTLAPDDYAAMIAMPATSFHNDVNAIDNHLAAVRRTEFDENNRWGYFAQAQGTFVDNDDARDTQTFDFNLYGILAGVDYRMSNTLIVGATLGYDRGKADIHHSGGKIESDDIRLTAYASVQLNDLVYANVGTQLGVGYYDAKRKTALGHADGDTSGFNAGVFADVGMDLTLSENLGLSARPYVGISFVHSIVSDFNDDLFEVGSFNGESLRTRIGCGLFWDVALGEMPSSIGLDVSYAHDFRGKEVDIDATYKATGRSFGVTAQTMTEDFFTLGPVISIGISDGVSAFAGYGLDIGTDSSIGQNVYIGVRASF